LEDREDSWISDVNSENLEDTIIKIDEGLAKKKRIEVADHTSEASTKHDTNEAEVATKVP